MKTKKNDTNPRAKVEDITQRLAAAKEVHEAASKRYADTCRGTEHDTAKQLVQTVANIAVLEAGAIIGDNIGFWVGRRYGLPLLLKYGELIHLHEERLKLGQYLFRHHGAKIVFFGRFIAVLRIFAALLAGVNHYRWGPFLFYNAAGGVVWAAIFGLGGYYFGDAVHRVSGPIGVAALIAAIAGIVGAWWIMRRQEHKLALKAEQEMPGHLEEKDILHEDETPPR